MHFGGGGGGVRRLRLAFMCFKAFSHINKNGVEVGLCPLLAALEAQTHENWPRKWAQKATELDPQIVKTQHVDNLHRNATYTIIPIVFCFIGSSITYMCRRFGVSRWIKIGHRFYVESKMDKNGSWRPPEGSTADL